MIKAIYPNLPIVDVEKTREFFTALGFTFNEKFSDEKALGMEICDGASVMLLKREFFETFIKREIADPHKTITCILAIQLEDRAAVDNLLEKAINAGGKEHREAQDMGFMYSRSFEDINGHIWEPFFMEEAA